MAVKRGDEEPPQVAVVPITNSRHSDQNTAIEIPPRVAKHLGLDREASWVVLDDVNVFSWQGYDL
jgi:hypothetical protein